MKARDSTTAIRAFERELNSSVGQAVRVLSAPARSRAGFNCYLIELPPKDCDAEMEVGTVHHSHPLITRSNYKRIFDL